jgi:ribonucleoside-diphosphate reductase alpha chain
MSYLQTLDTHNYDRWIHHNFNKIEKTLPEITKDEFFTYLNEIIQLANESQLDILIQYVPQTLRKNDIDGNTNYSCNMLAARIWKTIREKCDKATQELAEIFGEPELLKGYGRRNSTTIAVAPTTSSSFILGQISPSIEPLNSNYFTKDLAKGKFTYRNPYLLNLLKEKSMNTPEIWKDILSHGGSVQHLSFFTQEEKDVFKTFGEISQKEIIIQAAQRQHYIDQGQSLNIMVPASTKPKDINELMIFAWEQGIKSLYYQRSSNPSQQLARSILNCSTCEG